MQSLDLDVATEFLLIAATLVELKARRLLPGRADVDLDDELALWEERDLLLARLLECKTFKDVSRLFGSLADDAGRSFPRRVGPDERFAGLAPDLLAGLTPLRVRDAAIVALDAAADTADRPLPRRPDPGERRRRRRRAGRRAAACRADHVRPADRVLVERLDVIVRFLAVLELYKQGLVEVDQTDRFGDIRIEWCGTRDLPTAPSRSTPTRDEMNDDERRRAPPGDRGRRARRPRPGAAGVARPAPRTPRERHRAVVHRARRGLRGGASRLPARPRRRRLPLPDPPRPDALRRALRAPRPARQALGRGARDAGDRRLQAADLACPDRLDPRRRPRRRAAHAAGPRLHRRRRARPRPGPGRALRHHAGVPREARARHHRRPAADRRPHPRRRRGRGPRGRPAHHADRCPKTA